MDLLFTIGTWIGALAAAGALFAVWLKDKSHTFTRDASLGMFFVAFAPLSIYMFRSDETALRVMGQFMVCIITPVALTTVVFAARGLAGFKDAIHHYLYLFLPLFFLIFAAMFFTINPVIYAAVAASFLCLVLSGYIVYLLWSVGSIERTIGLCFLLTNISPIVMVFAGLEYLHYTQMGNIILRFIYALLVAYAAISRTIKRSNIEREKFEKLSARSKQGIIVSTLDRYLYVNDQAAKLYGFETAEAMIASGPKNQFEAAEFSQRQDYIKGVLDGSLEFKEIQGERKDAQGKVVYYRFQAWRIDWDGESAVQVLLSDETEKHDAKLLVEQTENKRAQEAELYNQELIAINNQLESRVALRTEELGKANANMQKALGDLQAAQQELIQREKLASLGRMIGGIAHELNTPIGNALTVVTTMGAGTQRTKDQFDQGRLSKQELTGFIDKNMAGVELVEKSLNRASELISSFQRVALDQSREPEERFDLAHALESARAMAMHDKPVNISISWVIDENIQLESKPGILAQVVAQLVDNAMQHAFEKDEPGLIRVQGSISGHDAELGPCALIEVVDNGKGIARENQKSIYDPMFTTALHDGSVGLGLHNAYAMTIRDLKGQIEYREEKPKGSRFAIKIPLGLRNSSA